MQLARLTACHRLTKGPLQKLGVYTVVVEDFSPVVPLAKWNIQVFAVFSQGTSCNQWILPCHHLPRGSTYTTIMELGPQTHNGDTLLGPNSVMVVYMDPLGEEC